MVEPDADEVSPGGGYIFVFDITRRSIRDRGFGLGSGMRNHREHRDIEETRFLSYVSAGAACAFDSGELEAIYVVETLLEDTDR